MKSCILSRLSIQLLIPVGVSGLPATEKTFYSKQNYYLNNSMLAKNLQVHDKIKSSTGNWLTVKKIEVTANRVIVSFDGDREIDFKPYDPIAEVEEFSKKG